MTQHVEAAAIAADVDAIERLVENAVTHQSEVEPYAEGLNLQAEPTWQSSLHGYSSMSS